MNTIFLPENKYYMQIDYPYFNSNKNSLSLLSHFDMLTSVDCAQVDIKWFSS